MLCSGKRLLSAVKTRPVAFYSTSTSQQQIKTNKKNNKEDNLKQNSDTDSQDNEKKLVSQPEGEVNGPSGPEPTRFGDWERKGRISDF